MVLFCRVARQKATPAKKSPRNRGRNELLNCSRTNHRSLTVKLSYLERFHLSSVSAEVGHSSGTFALLDEDLHHTISYVVLLLKKS